MDRFNFGNVEMPNLDLGMKIALGLATATSAATAIIVPNKRDKDLSSLELYDKPFGELHPEQQRVAEFAAGHKRWTNFIEHKWYPLTRKLPGAKKPILNPYRDHLQTKGQDEDD